MRKAKRFLKAIGLFLLSISWCVLQTIVGGILAISLLPFSRVQKYRGMIVVYHPFTYTFSLGTFAFISDRTEEGERARGRLYGHYVQSCLYGPFFFFVVSLLQIVVRIPSIRKHREERDVKPSDLFADRQAARLAAGFGE